MISPPFEAWSINSTNSKPVFIFQTINNETWTTPQACPTIYKSYPGKSIPLDTTTSYLNRPKTTCSNKDTACFPQTRNFDPLWLSSWREPDLLPASSSGKWQQQHNDKTTRQNNSTTSKRQETYTLIHPGYRVTFPKQNKKTENSHECDNVRKIGLSKTQSQKDSAALPSIPSFLQTPPEYADNPQQWQVNLESMIHQLFSKPLRNFAGRVIWT